jgi:hypothetical protein
MYSGTGKDTVSSTFLELGEQINDLCLPRIRPLFLFALLQIDPHIMHQFKD